MSFRFRPDVRLRARNEFRAVQESGRRVSTRCLIMLAVPNELGRDRLGIIASRRFGPSVVRARAKRRLREVFRLGEPDRPASSIVGRRSLDVVAIPKRELLSARFVDLQQEFGTAVDRLRRSMPAS